MAVTAMLAGACLGAAKVVQVNLVRPLLIALVLVSLVAAAARRCGTSDAAGVRA
jgi:hypothetical protein